MDSAAPMTKTAPLTQVFDLDRIKKLCGARAFAKASMIRANEIEGLTEKNGRLAATVRGTLPYSVELWVEGTRKAAWSCTCPQGEDSKFCKHAGAVALTMHGGGRAARAKPAAATPTDVESDPVFALLLGLDQGELAHLVYDAATRDKRTAQRLEALVAASVGKPKVDVKQWRKMITAAFGRPSHFVDYYEAPRWAEGVNGVLQDLRGLLDDGQAEAVVTLAEYAFERADKATQYVDSSDGWFEGISYDIADVHLQACIAARPEPVALARRLVQFDINAELDTFRRAAATYADVLGPDGLAEYRHLVEPAFEALGPREEHSWAGSERFHLTGAMLGLALATDDADEVIRIKSCDLRSPRDYAEIVTALHHVGRTDEAIEWARRGIAMPGRQFQARDLLAQLVELLREAGDPDAAHAARLEGFHQLPSLTTFKELLVETPEESRDLQRAEVLDWLRERAISGDGHAGSSVLVEILLYDGDVDGAWEVANTVGCDQRWWMTLARAREKDHPVDAIPVYQEAVEDLIDMKKSGAYKDAIGLIARLQHLYIAADAADDWTAYLDDVTTRHRQKSSFMAKVRDKGWLA